MMENVRDYMMSVLSVAIICSILVKMPWMGGTAGRMVKLCGGLILLFAILQPVANVKIRNPLLWLENIQAEAGDAIASGEMQTGTALYECIKKQAEAYILDKAETLGVALEVEIIMSEGTLPIPIGARLQGDISPYAKLRITSMIETELGISGDTLEWI
jgi:hypothetical protein